MKTKKEIKQLLEAGKLNMLINYIITDGTKSDIINALFILFKHGGEEYNISFESLPYSRGGRYARHTSTLYSTQKWEICGTDENGYYISKSSTSKSAACPDVIVPTFYTEIGKNYFNLIILSQIKELEKKLLK